jgi:hypothetical protein
MFPFYAAVPVAVPHVTDPTFHYVPYHQNVTTMEQNTTLSQSLNIYTY